MTEVSPRRRRRMNFFFCLDEMRRCEMITLGIEDDLHSNY